MTIGQRIVRLLRPIWLLADLVVPKRPDLWLFGDWGKVFFSGNGQAVWDAALRRTNVTLVGLARGGAKRRISGREVVLAMRSPAGIWAMLRAGVVITNGGLGTLYDFGCTRRRRVVANVWHGVPLKGIMGGNVAEMSTRLMRRHSRENRAYSFTISCSPVDRLAMAACLMVPLERVEVTGLPRNDWLVCDDGELPGEQQRAIEELKDLAGGDRILLIAPTYRDWESSCIEENIELAERLAVELRPLGVVPLLRPHPFDTELAKRCALNHDIILVDDKAFPSTQALLRAADLLITDYSSVWVDYLLLDRPIVGFVPDLDIYCRGRGLLYDYSRVFPGPLLASVDEVVEATRSTLGGVDDHAECRHMASALFHEHIDAEASDRVVTLIEGELREVQASEL